MPPSRPERPKPTASNRRNHYRILHVQPDAPYEVIRANYRTLMQKLKLHPDLGGDHWTAVQVNTAYAVLSDPARRKAYDRNLLASYDIATLSRGPLQPGPRPADAASRAASGDQRNFYRVLQVQVDAPTEVIEASHDALVSRGLARGLPLMAALATLRDPARRAAYDRALGLDRTARKGIDGATRAHPSGAIPPGAYEPLVTRYCLFCKTPHQATHSALEAGCVECGSPLFPPSAEFFDRIRRSLARSPQDEAIGFYAFWPGTRYSGHLVDLSPTGLCFLTHRPCQLGAILKVEGERIQAVGTVAHWHRDRSGTTAGIKFHTVGFRAQRGSFVSARA